MPELAEVEFYRRLWDRAARGQRATSVALHPEARVFKDVDAIRLPALLKGKILRDSEAAAKQMVFRFAAGRAAAGTVWLGIHLGMSGDLAVRALPFEPGRHDHLVLYFPKQALVFSDYRKFGRVLAHVGTRPPEWWTSIAPAILSKAFTSTAVASFLQRRSRAPIKGVLLMQERFPGIGNWMADEILWRARIHPRRAAGSLSATETKRLWKETRDVSRLAIAAIAGKGRNPPKDLDSARVPKDWLFHRRWRKGGTCPISGKPLAHATIAGRTTCWSPALQKAQGAAAGGMA